MIKQAGILLTLCATSLVIINIRTLETVERSGRGIDDDDPYNDKDDYGLHFPNEDPNQGFCSRFARPNAPQFRRGWLG